MRIIYLITLLCLFAGAGFGQQKLQVHNSGDTMFSKEISAIDSIKLDGTYARFKIAGNANTVNIQKKFIDSLTFTTGVVNTGKIYIIYNGNDDATIINPYETQGLTLTATGGAVVGTAATGIANLEYNILGSSTNGSLELATDMDVNLVLNNVTLTNPSGAAFSVTGAKVTNFLLTPGTTNTLSDGAASTRNGTITTDGPVVINTSMVMNNTGLLTITAVKKHGINTSSTITVLDGLTTISSAASDGFHSEGYFMNGGTATITSLADGIDAGNGAIVVNGGTINVTSTANDVKAIKTGTGRITFNDGTINLDVSGAQSKGISAKGNIAFNNGTFAITISGATVLTASGSGFNPSYATAVKSDSIITVSNGMFTIQSLATADGGKGFSAGGAINVTGGNITVNTAGNGGNYINQNAASDTYSVSGFSTDDNVTVSGGVVNLNNTGAGGRGLSADGNVNISGSAQINITNSGAAGKGFRADGNVTFDGGTTTMNISGATVLTPSGSGSDLSYPTGVKTTGNVVVNAGTINIQAPATATGAKGFSSDQNINVNGGNITISTAGNGANYTTVSGVADSYSSACISADINTVIAGGTLNLTNSGADGKGISDNGNVDVSGTSQLTITNSGSSGKGVKADGAVTFDGGTTAINLSGATVLTPSGSGNNPSYPTGIKAATGITVNSGSVTVQGSATATGTKGLSSTTITVNGGNVSLTTAGNGATYTNTTGTLDSYASAAISADNNITINGGTVTTNSSGTGGKGLNSDGTIFIGTATGSPTLNITTTGARFLVSGTNYTHPKTIVAAKAVIINNGTNTINSTDDGIHSDTMVQVNGGNNIVNAISTVQAMGEGVEAPLISFTGGVTNVTASNDGLNGTYGTVAGGIETNDGSNINISGGIVIVAGKDAIDANGNLTISGGTTIVSGPASGPDEGIDYNGTFLMNGGFLISGGPNSNMTKAMSTASTQRGMYLKSSAQLPATSILHIENAAGTEMVTYKPKNAVAYFHFSSPAVTASTQYKVYFGGSYTGGGFVGNSTGWGLYNGGTYSTTGATLKTTLTSSATSTVTTATF